jgi:hypothetical protein
MTKKDARILATGLEKQTFERIAPELRREALKVDWVVTLEEGVALAAKNRYDLIIMDAEPCDWPLEKVVSGFRSASATSCDASIMVLSGPDQADAAQKLKSCGVNRVMLTSDPPEVIREQLLGLLDVAPRTSVRLPLNLEAAQNSIGGELFCQTENLSTSGMFIRTRHRPKIGSTAAFKIHLADGGGTVVGRGEVVRHSLPDKEGIDGVAVRFISLGGNGALKLRGYLEARANGSDADTGVWTSPRPQTKDDSDRKGQSDVILEFE